jgi:hypothetical protein
VKPKVPEKRLPVARKNHVAGSVAQEEGKIEKGRADECLLIFYDVAWKDLLAWFLLFYTFFRFFLKQSSQKRTEPEKEKFCIRQ